MNTKGFTTLHILLFLLILCVIGGTGWLVYSRQDDKQPATTTQLTRQTQDSSNTFRYAYPADWTLKPYVWENCCEGEKQEPDWSQVSQPITLLPPGIQPAETFTEETAKVTLSYYKLDGSHGGRLGDATNYDEMITNISSDPFFEDTFERLFINGREALYHRTDYLGPPDAKVESFTDHHYYFINGDMLLEVYFLEKRHHDWHPDQERDNSQYKAEFEQIAHSISFF